LNPILNPVLNPILNPILNPVLNQAIPHIEFWRELPNLIKEGIGFTKTMTEQGCEGTQAFQGAVARAQGAAYDTIGSTDFPVTEDQENL